MSAAVPASTYALDSRGVARDGDGSQVSRADLNYQEFGNRWDAAVRRGDAVREYAHGVTLRRDVIAAGIRTYLFPKCAPRTWHDYIACIEAEETALVRG